jgi:hypothetical protein
MLLHVDGEVIEIRPGEILKSHQLIESRYLEVIEELPKEKKKSKPKKQTFTESIKAKNINANSSST